jgi:phosphatidylinositol alpha-mannosyltransferase
MSGDAGWRDADAVRIALVCPYSWTVPGGVQSHVLGLAQALRERGHEADILAPADGPVDLPGFVAVGRSLPIRDNGSKVRVALGPAAAVRVVRALSRGGYDLAHLHEPMIPVTCLSALLSARIPLVGTFHMYASGPRWYRPFSPLARRAVPRLAARIAVSEAALRHVSRTVPGEYHVIPNGIDTRAFACEGPRHGNRIIFIGRSERRKGLPVLLDAFGALPGEPLLDLVGVERPALARVGRHLPADVLARVRAHGRVSDAERTRLLAEADVLCAPSLRGESFGIVLLEAMAAGLPVVASSIPGYIDVASDSCGRLVPPGNREALEAALAELLTDAALRERLGAEGRRLAARYDWSQIVERVLAVYSQALGAAKARGARPAVPATAS